ncbi:hypothetical protein LSTR_LSTR016751 [Laodelphax striatellus]|uniref:Uncharacterized protein n=1 Tax=Laodelphax striatellus TaxID=195883 RepID=A0A482XSP5_LAOST|nr:hypothetical protein LSTR_LSTR016751 [Laodelphax striatellus]
MDLNVKPIDKSLGEKARKRVVTPDKWKRAQLKKNRYAAKGFPDFPTCQHDKGALQCKSLTAQDIRRFHSAFYSEKDKIYQDNFILKHLVMQPIKRRRPKTSTNTVKEARAKYFIRNLQKEMIPCATIHF